ncbi:MAG: formylglycine-generating enzyme family protein [Thiofilum sp.]|uniref:formylglycine-generating enzyme family protein n=1 Tax=Thiofilum sp. TaxID=2212733 RepID=UPI0025D88CDA|nr:formylglycine-generating enzyme family protein [Thiofilum sp.]MBK8454034.1 formylglycine-generating enzyme family protein [Thiofilum sp.]
MERQYFWVNQGYNFEKEVVTNGYIRTGESQRKTSLNLKTVCPNDLIFSYALGAIQAVGVAKSVCYDTFIPKSDNGKNARPGWRVNVEFKRVSAFDPKPFFDEIKPLLPKDENSPFDKNGSGKQNFYLGKISKELSDYLLKNLKLYEYSEGLPQNKPPKNQQAYGYTIFYPAFPYVWASAWGQDQYGLWQALTLKKPPHLIKGQDKLRYGDSAEVRYVFRWMPAGTFWMGTSASEKNRYETESYHQVILTKGFWLSETPVTQELYQLVMGSNPSFFSNIKNAAQTPVTKVSWLEAKNFIERFNQLHPDLKARLPSDAEWEYACRAGTTTPLYYGDTPDLAKTNYRGNNAWQTWGEGALKTPNPVKNYPCNPWGLYDMLGNVWEWCEDIWRENLGIEAVTDPLITTEKIQDKGQSHVLRGGSYHEIGRGVRSAVRWREPAKTRRQYIGFRLALLN